MVNSEKKISVLEISTPTVQMVRFTLASKILALLEKCDQLMAERCQVLEEEKWRKTQAFQRNEIEPAASQPLSLCPWPPIFPHHSHQVFSLS